MSRSKIDETVTVYGLAGFSKDPSPYGNDTSALINNCDAIVYALDPEWLPHGGWRIQGGTPYETVVKVSVPVDSHEAKSALSNSRAEGYIV